MNAVIITGNKYPLEDAGAIRQHATAKIFEALGYDVLVLGYGVSTNGETKVYDNISYVSFRPAHTSFIIRALYRYYFINRVERYIRKNIKKIDVLLVVDVLPKDFKKIVRIARIYNSKLVHDSVEWYSPEEFIEGEKNRSFRNKEYTNTIAIKEPWRVIAISKFLENHFKTRCNRVVRIPVILDVKNIVPNYEINNSKISFVYAGGPGKKDFLNVIIQAFSSLPNEVLHKVELHIVGVSREQLLSFCDVKTNELDLLNGIVYIHGRVAHNDAVKFVMNASYTILIRNEDCRYAKAGFPTKVVESLSYGTPVLCNYSSDLDEYLENRVNSVISNGHSAENVKDAIIEAINIDKDLYNKMRINARKTAEYNFDYRDYILNLDSLIS